MDGTPNFESSIFNMPELNLDIYVTYVCGNCGNESKNKPTEDIICHNCSSRILFKKRRNSGLQCEAR